MGADGAPGLPGAPPAAGGAACTHGLVKAKLIGSTAIANLIFMGNLLPFEKFH